MKEVVNVEECLYTFKMDDYYLNITVLSGLLVNTGTILHISRDTKKFKNYDQTFQPENHYMELADGTKTRCVALKRGDTKVCLRDTDVNHVLVTLKKGTTRTLLLTGHFSCESRDFQRSDSYSLRK